MQKELSALRSTLERLGYGVVKLDRSGSVHLITPQAEQLLAHFFKGEHTPARGLPQSVQNWVRQQGYLDRDDVLRPRAPMVVNAEGQRLRLRLLPESEGSTLLL